MVGVFDYASGLNGFIDPNSTAFVPQNIDRPYYFTSPGSNTVDQYADRATPVFTRGNIFGQSNLDISGNATIYSTLTVYGNETVSGSVNFLSSLTVAADTKLLGNLYVAGSLIGSSLIGDANILWQAYTGSGSLAGGTLANNASYISADSGVRLNNGSSTNGQFYWTRSYVPTQAIIINATLQSATGGGNSGDATNIFIGSTHIVGSSADANSGIVVTINEDGGDSVKVYLNGAQKPNGSTTIATGATIGNIVNNTWRNWNIILEPVAGGTVLVTVEVNGIYMGAINVGTLAAFPGTYVGVNGWAGSDNTSHYVKTFGVKSARAWELLKY